MTDPILVAAGALAAGKNPRAVLDAWAKGAAVKGDLPAPLTSAHDLAARIAVAVHRGDSGDGDPLALLPDLIGAGATPPNDSRSALQLTQLLALLTIYYDDAERLREQLVPSLWARLIARFYYTRRP